MSAGAEPDTSLLDSIATAGLSYPRSAVEQYAAMRAADEREARRMAGRYLEMLQSNDEGMVRQGLELARTFHTGPTMTVHASRPEHHRCTYSQERAATAMLCAAGAWLRLREEGRWPAPADAQLLCAEAALSVGRMELHRIAEGR